MLLKFEQVIIFIRTPCFRFVKCEIMSCTVKKCWPELTSGACGGSFHQLSQLSDSARGFLMSINAWNNTTPDNPEYMWQVYLSHVTASTFSLEEISGFTICNSHKVDKTNFYNNEFKNIWQETLANKFTTKNKGKRRCSICCSNTDIRAVTLSFHKKLFKKFLKVVPIGAGI